MTAERLHERFEDRLFGIVSINDEAHGPIHAGDQEKAIDKGHMIGNEQCSTGLRNMGLADDPEPIERIGEDDQHQPEERVGQQPERPSDAASVMAAGCHKNAGGREPGVGQRTAGERSQQDAGEDAGVGKRNDGAAPIGRGFPLEDGVQRNEDE